MSSDDKARQQVLAERMESAKTCNCGNVGWYVHANRNTGEPEQEQCEFCYTVPDSMFNVLEDVKEFLRAPLSSCPPEKPTPVMFQAWIQAEKDNGTFDDCYAAMMKSAVPESAPTINAAPQAPCSPHLSMPGPSESSDSTNVPSREQPCERGSAIQPAGAAPVSAIPRFDLSRYINAADISASDMPHTVVERLQAAIDADTSRSSSTAHPAIELLKKLLPFYMPITPPKSRAMVEGWLEEYNAALSATAPVCSMGGGCAHSIKCNSQGRCEYAPR